MDTQFLTNKFSAGLAYGDYVTTGKEEHRLRWTQSMDKSRLTDAQSSLLGSFKRRMNILVVTGIWCGDCAMQGPLLQRIAMGNPDQIQLRFLDRDLHSDLSGQLKINGGVRVPAVIFMAEDFEFCGTYGERPLSRYRVLARKKLGESYGIGISPPVTDEHADTLADWLNEFERIQLLLRISPRLREKHKD